MSLRDLFKGATARPWVAFDSGDARGATLAVMKGPRPPARQRGEPYKRWDEIVAWTGFDGADVPHSQRRANLHLIIGAVNALKPLLDALDEACDALDLADSIIEVNVGTDTPAEWHRAMRRVARAQARIPTA